MGVEYPPAIDMFVPIGNTFDWVDQETIVEHCTGGDQTVEAIYNTFYNSGKSSHFGIGYEGQVAQYVSVYRGSGANCCPDSSHNSFWDPYIYTYGNLNLCGITIEHCNDGSQSRPMTDAQMAASLDLNLWLSQKFGIDSAHVWYHSSICATNCPGSLFLNNSLPMIKRYIDQGGTPTSKGKKVEPEMVQLALNVPVVLCPPPGNSTFECAGDFANGYNVRLYGHVEGTTRWENKSFNIQPGKNAFHVNIGPAPNWAVDYISVSLTEVNPAGNVPTVGCCIWPI